MRTRINLLVSLVIVLSFILIISMGTVHALDLGQRVLKFGHIGADVRTLQTELKDLGYYYHRVDSIYGKLTERAVINFQQANKLRIDGIAGYDTINRLQEITNKSNNNIYYVQRGDTLSEIAAKFNVSLEKLRLWNNINHNYIHVGQKIIIKAAYTQVSTHRLSREELDLLARAVHSEARGEELTGKVAVASVVLNRIEDSKFPNTIKGVVFEPWAFTAVHDGQFWLNPDSSAYRAVKLALEGWDPTAGATFYYNPAKVTSHWIYTRPIITKIGRHYFAS